MRSSHVVATVAVLSAGLTAAAALHRRTATRLSAPPATATTAPAVEVVPERDGVVLPFVRPVATAPAPAQPATPARCGDNGGRTKAGAPCASRATTAGRCHHHRLAS